MLASQRNAFRVHTDIYMIPWNCREAFRCEPLQRDVDHRTLTGVASLTTLDVPKLAIYPKGPIGALYAEPGTVQDPRTTFRDAETGCQKDIL